MVLSPAKTLDENAVNGAVSKADLTRPSLEQDAEALVEKLQELPVGKLKSLLGVSDAIAK